jgi:hypothetical protein
MFTLSITGFPPPPSVLQPQGADSLPLPLHVTKTSKNNVNEEITPLLPTGTGERFSQTISNLGHVKSPYNESAELTRGAL